MFNDLFDSDFEEKHDNEGVSDNDDSFEKEINNENDDLFINKEDEINEIYNYSEISKIKEKLNDLYENYHSNDINKYKCSIGYKILSQLRHLFY